MNGLKTARALILDDKESEGLIAIHALSSLGIGFVYHTGTEIPTDYIPHTGLRLLILDMILVEGIEDPKNAISILMGTLSSLIDPQCDSLVVVSWSKEKEVVEQFPAAFKETFPKARLANFINVNKSDFEDEEKFEALKERINSSLKGNDPLSLLNTWEQTVHDSASATSQFMQQSASINGNRLEGGYKLAASLAIANGGTRLISDINSSTALRAFTNSLVPLLADRIENEANALASQETSDSLIEALIAENKKIGRKKSSLSPETRAYLNTSINISRDTAIGEAQPGSIYDCSKGNKNRIKIKYLFSNSQWELALLDSIQKDFHQRSKRPTPIPILLEISPACDYAQAKNRTNRFCIGFFFTSETVKTIGAGAHLNKVGPIFLRINESEIKGYLVFNCHYTITTNTNTARTLEPSGRLRSSPLASVVSWQAMQLSRPGYIEVRP